MPFLDSLDARKVAGTVSRWKLLAQLRWVAYKDLNFYTVNIPEGFECDGASIPRFFWRLIGPPWGEYARAAVLHDYLYRFGKIEEKEITRKRADQIFYGGMIDVGVRPLKAWAMYQAVRFGAGGPWSKYRKGGKGETR